MVFFPLFLFHKELKVFLKIWCHVIDSFYAAFPMFMELLFKKYLFNNCF
jgi:hypothetical protein